MISQEGPAARPSFLSRVTKGQSNASANATCQGVIAGQVLAQLPHPLGKRHERKKFHIEPEQTAEGEGCLYA